MMQTQLSFVTRAPVSNHEPQQACCDCEAEGPPSEIKGESLDGKPPH